MSLDHFETTIQPEELPGDPRNSMSDAELLEINTWDDILDPDAMVLNHGHVYIRKNLSIEEMIEELMLIFYTSPTRMMRFGEWGGITHPSSSAIDMKWGEWS